MWSAPELLDPKIVSADNNSVRPTCRSDVYSFAITCIEVRNVSNIEAFRYRIAYDTLGLRRCTPEGPLITSLKAHRWMGRS